MNGSCRRPIALAAGLLAGCAGPPPPPPPAPPPPVARPAEPPPAAATPKERPERAQVVKLANGLTVSITEAGPGAEAHLQLGLLVGSVFVAPGLAELAVETVVRSSDVSQGRPSLAQAVAKLGGVLQVEVGPLTTWINVRVPGTRWRAAEAALLAALAAPSPPRSQLERIRDELVQARCASIEADPTTGMARALLLAEPDTSAYVTSLLDRDASEVGLFMARLFHPERALLALQVPGDPAAAAAYLAKEPSGSLSRWRPPLIAAPPPRILERNFTSGFYWSPGPKAPTCRAALVLFLPDPARGDAADLLLLHACITLDGTGGRLERLQAERGLSNVRWRSEFVQGADTIALVLTADVAPADAVRLWSTLQAARSSLRDVPPTASEIGLASRRAMLTAGLGQLDAMSRLRIQTSMLVRGASMAQLERRFAELSQPGAPKTDAAVAEFLKLPASLVVVGGQIPADAVDVRKFDVLPPGLHTERPPDRGPQTVAATPWLDRAIEAVGGAALLRRLVGFDAEGLLQTERAPAAHDKVTWRVGGKLVRVRELLGSTIETRLEEATWTEQVADKKVALSSKEAALLRREMERHPLAILAAHARGALTFEAVAQRSVGDRDLMVLEAVGDRFDRLRIHVDTVSHLIRVAETWETMPDGTTVHLEEAWSDYRSTGGLRAPFRRITTQDDGQNRVETVYSQWRPVISAP